jgi:hypothetical protein
VNFNKHWELNGKHAFLSASKYHWLNYDTEKLISAYNNWKAKERGTRLHEFACEAILLGVKLSNSKRTLNRYVNDAIGFGMTPEVVLYYSDNCFGTADAISYDGNELRIHDLKTGKTPASFDQLLIYAALFCFEYGVDPRGLSDVCLRIYQLDEVLEMHPEAEEILSIMDIIVESDKVIDQLRKEE